MYLEFQHYAATNRKNKKGSESMKKKLISLSVALLMLMQFAFPALATEPKKSNSAYAENEPQKPATFAEQTKTYTKENSVTYDKEGEDNNLRYGIKDG